MGKQADIFKLASKIRSAGRNGTGTSFTPAEVVLMFEGKVVDAIYALEKDKERELICHRNDNTNLVTAGSGSAKSVQAPSGKSVGMTPEEEQRAVRRRRFGVVSTAD